MHRLLAVLMLVLLPFQFSWAAVASYCMHERTSAQVQHVGHHEHKHEASSLPDKDGHGLQAADAFDVDCCLCHGLGIGVTRFFVDMKASTAPISVVIQSALPLSSIAPSPPERPQWRPLA